MDHAHLIQFFLIFLLIFSINANRALYYDELDLDESEETKNSQSQLSDKLDPVIDEFNDNKDVQQRSVLDQPSQNRQQLIDLLRKAYSHGWKPNLKHYMPATRFGRHLR